MDRKNELSRRNFIWRTIGSTAAITMGTKVFSAEKELKEIVGEGNLEESMNILDPIIPFEFYPDLEKEMLDYIITLREQYGFRRFLLTGPSKESRYTGFPEKQVFRDLGELILRVKKQLANYDVEIGWWCVTTIRIGKGPFQSIVRADGSVANEACCPLDADFRKTFSEYIGTVVEIAQPFWINFEDDYHLSGGCYCPLHLDEFAKREKRYYTRDELVAIMKKKTPEAKRLRHAWGELSRDSLAGLAASVRTRVDQIAPETRLCLCQSGNDEREGNFTEAVTLAFAGNTRPAVRAHGSSYFSDSPLDLPKTVFSPLYQRQHLPPDFEIIHESDTFPHTRFFMSASKLKSLMTAVFAYGLDDSLFYATQYLPNPLEEEGYLKMFQKESRRLSALKLSVQNCKVDGCEIFRKPEASSNWVHITGRLGIPHTSEGGKVKLISGDIIDRLSEQEINDLLQGSVFLDGHAALLLSQRGYSKMIGAEVSSRKDTKLHPFYESIRNPEEYKNVHNSWMYNYVWAFNSSNKDAIYQIRPLEGAEIVADLVNSENQSFYPGMVRFENELGGRVAVMAYNLNDSYIYTRCISIFNYSKKELIHQVIEWLGKEPLPVFVKQIPNTFCIFNRSVSNDYAIAVIIGLSSDSFDSFSLDIAPEWINSRFELLHNNGMWKSADTESENRTLKVNTGLSLMSPVVLRFTKQS